MSLDGSYRTRLAEAIDERRDAIAAEWLRRLSDVVHEDRRDIFPTATYLDHIPTLIGEIAVAVRRADDAAPRTNPLVTGKAIELGELRHAQKATVHQLLREYDLLSAVLEEMAREVTAALAETPPPLEVLDAVATIERVVRSIARITLDTFVERYTATIAERTERLRSLNSFISHELRTPLQSASLMLETLLAERGGARDGESVDNDALIDVQRAIERMAEILSGVEKLIEPDAASGDDPTRQAVDIGAVARDVAAQQAAAFAERGVALEIDDDLGVAVVDTARLVLVLSNLLDNAAKYSDPDKRERRVRVVGAPADTADTIAVAVSDNGLGIEPSRQQEVFGLHARAHASLDAANEVSGRGIGLYLVAETVREMGGTLRLESAVGRGSEFTLCLPRRAPSPG